MQTLDNLQAVGALSIEQYQHHLRNLQLRNNYFDLPEQINLRLKESEKNPEGFCASKYYCCAGFNRATPGDGLELSVFVGGYKQ